MGFAFFGESAVFGAGVVDALGERFDFRFAADGCFAEFREAVFHWSLLFLGGLFRTAFDSEFGAEVVEVVGEFAFALDE